MFTKFATSAVVCLALVFTVSKPATAADYDCYGAFSIYNPYSQHIYYQVRWGDGAWKTICLEPYKSRVHSYPLNEYGRAQSPQVRFDYITGDNKTTYKTFSIDFYRAHRLADAKPHHFSYSACGTRLNLYAGKY